MLHRLHLSACGAMVSALFSASTAAAPLKLADYLALGGPAPSARISYGAAPSQYVELFRPAGAGPFPVALLVHGGCWTVKFGGITQMRVMAGALAAQGIAVWNIEYRRVDEAGGGYPGTYQDINAAIDQLQAGAVHYQLDTSRVVAIGHSAGGHLVQWMAGRGKIAPASVLYQGKQLPVRRIINLGGLADLRHEQALIKSSCDRDVTELTGAPAPGRGDVYADTDPASLMPNGSETVFVNGDQDNIAPPRSAHDYARRANAAGDKARVVILPNASHYDEVAVASPAWKLILPLIRQALGMPAAAATPSAPASEQ